MRLVCLVLSLLSIPLYAAPVRMGEYIPINAYEYLPLVYSESVRLIPDAPRREYYPALIEHESCLSLTHRRCWNPSARLQSKRELGIGLGQTTITYNADGSVRYDGLGATRKQYMSELKDLSWANIQYRADLQIRALLLMSRENYKALYSIKDPIQRLLLADVAYNHGLGNVRKEIRVCGLTKGCNPQLWTSHVEKICVTSKKPLYAGRSSCDISRDHPKDVFKRMNKYKLYYERR